MLAKNLRGRSISKWASESAIDVFSLNGGSIDQNDNKPCNLSAADNTNNSL